jgi:Kef-type K+ transport system membrane component KefB
MKNKRLKIILATAAILLSVPFIAMQFTSEVDWSPGDFIIMGILLFGTGMICEFIMRKVKNTNHRIMICAAVLFVFFLIWAELAVGIFGTPFAGS